MVNPPYPPESNTTISSPEADTLIAFPKLRHGAVNVQALLSLPKPDTHARPAQTDVTNTIDTITKLMVHANRFIALSFLGSFLEKLSPFSILH
jgi:hypothetical protein